MRMGIGARIVFGLIGLPVWLAWQIIVTVAVRIPVWVINQIIAIVAAHYAETSNNETNSTSNAGGRAQCRTTAKAR